MNTTEKLEAENARLRKRLAQYELFECVVGDPLTEFARLRREFHRLQRENVKLRELVETMRVDMCEMLDIIDKSSDTRGYCRYYDECLDAAEDIMRELRIEVK